MIGLEETNWFSHTDGVFIHGALYNREKTQKEGQFIGTSHSCLAVDYDRAHQLFMEFHNPDKNNGHLVYNYIPVCDADRKDKSTEDKMDPDVEKFINQCKLKQKQAMKELDQKLMERIKSDYEEIQRKQHLRNRYGL